MHVEPTQVLQTCEIGFTYPPAFAFLMTPFVALPLWLGTLIWYGITLACMVWCCQLCEQLTKRMFPGPWLDRDLEWIRFFGVLISLKFILAVYEDQAYDFFVLPWTLFGILALTERRNVAAGAALAVAAALKVAPLIFLPYLVFKATIRGGPRSLRHRAGCDIVSSRPLPSPPLIFLPYLVFKRQFAAAGIFVIVLVAISFLPDLFLHPQGGTHGYFMTWVHEVAAPGLMEDAAASESCSGPAPILTLQSIAARCRLRLRSITPLIRPTLRFGSGWFSSPSSP